MITATIKRNLFKEISKLIPEIKDSLNYGIPHIIGEITQGEGIFLQIVTYADKEQQLIVNDESKICFILPVKETKAYKLFIDVLNLIENRGLKPGSTIMGDLKSRLEKLGYKVVWITPMHDFVEVITVKGGERYRMKFEELHLNEFKLVSINEI
ncbi:hypothetical protein [Pyrococcus horikoshii]|uniref:Uncharacterized protein n=2 Tax=Pyrococcus horikoshii TaxID=53953 RepID=O58357_PYRHO|nr:hypothetical protein [Pyrococcus horikoshii]BAA29712.1 153aa long hypothetical protein [Pyrococcus horikoshii OT3]HII60166.1 hypothetical protein [Pyrococcus horikoshii]